MHSAWADDYGSLVIDPCPPSTTGTDPAPSGRMLLESAGGVGTHAGSRIGRSDSSARASMTARLFMPVIPRLSDLHTGAKAFLVRGGGERKEKVFDGVHRKQGRHHHHRHHEREDEHETNP